MSSKKDMRRADLGMFSLPSDFVCGTDDLQWSRSWSQRIKRKEPIFRVHIRSKLLQRTLAHTSASGTMASTLPMAAVSIMHYRFGSMVM